MLGTATSHVTVRHMVLETLKTDLPTSPEMGVYFSNYFPGESSCVTGISQGGNWVVDMFDSPGHS